ncbi:MULTISPECIES: hypothetical protein [unclassified Mycoplasma]|uniref:hypothetical protein n=1 Tax=unclassified Mycoplasma TaxID=2683645 RepID=UPI00211BFE0B|nr:MULTISPECIES: hypothetical protein [unclassified Mycoplasma]UUM19678.1 hypothetical protein NPA11_02820 [Mycoplasma sp. 1578d]UUM24661.1 hypothetical protein NPA12_03115 [Mycoplasma sp. 3686d]
MKKRLSKILYSGLFIGAFGSIAVGCETGKVTQQQIPQGPIEGNNIDLSDSLLYLNQIPSSIIKDLSSTGVLNKLLLVPNSSTNSIDIRPFDYGSSVIDSLSKQPLLSKTPGLNIALTLVKNNQVKLGQIRSSKEKDKALEFYEKDIFFVKDSSNQWVKLDFSKENQYLPVTIDKDNNFVIEYKIQKEGSDKPTEYTKTIRTSSDSEKLKQEIADLLEKDAKQNENKVKKFLDQAEMGIDSASNFLLTSQLVDQSLKDGYKNTIETIKEAKPLVKKIKELFDQVLKKELTNSSISQLYFDIKKLISKFINTFVDDTIELVKKNRMKSDEEVKADVDRMKSNLTFLKGFLTALPFLTLLSDFIESSISKYEDPKTKDQILFEIKNDDVLLKTFATWIGLDLEKINALKLTNKDLVSFLSLFFEVFKIKSTSKAINS